MGAVSARACPVGAARLVLAKGGDQDEEGVGVEPALAAGADVVGSQHRLEEAAEWRDLVVRGGHRHDEVPTGGPGPLIQAGTTPRAYFRLIGPRSGREREQVELVAKRVRGGENVGSEGVRVLSLPVDGVALHCGLGQDLNK